MCHQRPVNKLENRHLTKWESKAFCPPCRYKEIFCLLGGKELQSSAEPNGWAVTVKIQGQKNLHKLLLFEAPANSDLIRTKVKAGIS